MTSVQHTPESRGNTLFQLPQPVIIGNTALHCAQVDDPITQYRISLEGTDYFGSSPDTALRVLPLPVRQMVSGHLGNIAKS